MLFVKDAPPGSAGAGLEASAAARPVAGSLEYELKFVLPSSRAAFVRSWIASSVPPDRVFPPARVVTVYYDTRALGLLHQKLNSDYLKTKVRVRWYAGRAGEDIASPVFAECKYRVGASRRKVRVRLAVSSGELDVRPLDHPAWVDLLAPLGGQVDLPADLAPVLRLRYVRCRFTDRDGARVTLDSDIRVEATNPARVAAPAVPGPLTAAVFEYKGSVADLPAHLGAVVRFGGRKGSFSKYMACYEHIVRQSH